MGQVDVVKTYSDPAAMLFQGRTLLHYAAEFGQYGVVDYLRKKVDINAKDYNEMSAIQYATIKGYEKVVVLLLEHGANNVDLERSIACLNGRTPVFFVAKNNHFNMMTLLLERNLIQLFYKKNHTMALHAAMHGGSFQTARLLLEKNADPNTVTDQGFTSLHLAANVGDVEIMRLLCDSGAKIDHQDKHGYSALYYAINYAIECQEVDVSAVKFLLQKKANLELYDIVEKKRPLHLAVLNGSLELVEIFINHKADINAKCNEGTALYLAYTNNSVEIVEFLLIRGASLKNLIPTIEGIENIFFSPLDPPPRKEINKLLNFEKKFRSMLELVSNKQYPDSNWFNLPTFLKSDMWKDLEKHLQTISKDCSRFERRLLAFFQNPKEWLALDDDKFKKFCEILLKFTNNDELIKIAKEFAREGLARDQKSVGLDQTSFIM